MDGHDVLSGSGVSIDSRAGLEADPCEMERESSGDKSTIADELRDLAAKGLCSPLWRATQPVQQVGRREVEKSLWEGWCRRVLESSPYWRISQFPALQLQTSQYLDDITGMPEWHAHEAWGGAVRRALMGM